MNNFHKYYNTKFRSDIENFFSTIPDESKFHEDCVNKQIFSIQFERLTRMHNHLDFLTTNQEKINFAVALFFTVLVDEVCYTYYRSDYNEFQRLTRYPKLIGNCLSWCRFHLHPREVFRAMNQNKRGTPSNYLVFCDTFFEAIPIMEREIKNFFDNYFPLVSGIVFWDKCIAEFPYRPIVKESDL